MEREFQEYFNFTLRNALRYPETFTLDFYQGKFILHPSEKSGLIDLIRSNPEIKSQLLKTVSKFLRKYIPSASNVVFSTDGTNLIVNYSLEELTSTIPTKSYLQAYANIASNLNVDQLNDFCTYNKEFHEVCKDPVFWITLFKERFPKRYKEIKNVNNWEPLYKALLYYLDKDLEIGKLIQSNPRDIDTAVKTYWNNILNEYLSGFEILIQNGLFNFTLDDIANILMSFEHRDLYTYKIQINDVTLNKLIKLFPTNVNRADITRVLRYVLQTKYNGTFKILYEKYKNLLSESNKEQLRSTIRRSSFADTEFFNLINIIN